MLLCARAGLSHATASLEENEKDCDCQEGDYARGPQRLVCYHSSCDNLDQKAGCDSTCDVDEGHDKGANMAVRSPTLSSLVFLTFFRFLHIYPVILIRLPVDRRDDLLYTMQRDWQTAKYEG